MNRKHGFKENTGKFCSVSFPQTTLAILTYLCLLARATRKWCFSTFIHKDQFRAIQETCSKRHFCTKHNQLLQTLDGMQIKINLKKNLEDLSPLPFLIFLFKSAYVRKMKIITLMKIP